MSRAVMEKYLRVTFRNGERYDIPVSVIARDRASCYAFEFNGDIEQSLKEDTLPLFDECDYEIEDWAVNNMNWSEVVQYARRVDTLSMTAMEYQEGWMNGEKEIVWGANFAQEGE